MVYFSAALSLQKVPVLNDMVDVLTGSFINLKCQSVALQQGHVDVALVLGMLSVQVCRRLYECVFVSVFSDARIHLFHYVLGMWYYPAVALTSLLHLHTVDHTGTV